MNMADNDIVRGNYKVVILVVTYLIQVLNMSKEAYNGENLQCETHF